MSIVKRTLRISDLDTESALEQTDEIVFVDKSDLSSSQDGTDKKITVRDFAESVPIRPSGELTVQKSLSEWIEDLRSTTETLATRTETATTANVGVSRLASDLEAQDKTAGNRVLTPRNLDSLGATESLAGLIALASDIEVDQGEVDDKAITPKTFFDNILGASTFGSSNWVFRLPVKNIGGNAKTELVFQVGQHTFTTEKNELDPESNFNHTHQQIEFDVTYPEPFDNRALLVIPIGVETTPTDYTEGTDFWIRQYESRADGATLRASRISGLSDGSEQGAVRYLAIGY